MSKPSGGRGDSPRFPQFLIGSRTKNNTNAKSDCKNKQRNLHEFVPLCTIPLGHSHVRPRGERDCKQI